MSKHARAHALAERLSALDGLSEAARSVVEEAARVLREQAAEIEMLWEHRTTAGELHSHECIWCGHTYTPAPEHETEDCPRCGCDGAEGWVKKALEKRGAWSST